MPNSIEILNKNASQTSECLVFAATPLPDAMPHANRLKEWLSRGYNAGMNWMSQTFCAKEYNAAWVGLWKYPRNLQKNQEPIAAFAHGKDYHITVGAILRSWAAQVGGKPFVDSLPIAERELASMAGLGFIGKNTMLINPELGSAFFIGGVLLKASSNSMQINGENICHCSDCRRCIDACPNNALTEDGFLDARKCASYLTIEHRGEFTEEQRNFAKHSVFGCDICQRACPYNAKHLAESKPYFSPDESEWKKATIKETPLRRAGTRSLRRNFTGLRATQRCV